MGSRRMEKAELMRRLHAHIMATRLRPGDFGIITLTETEDFGVYTFQSREWLETREFAKQWVGQGPIVVDNETGEITAFGSAMSAEDAERICRDRKAGGVHGWRLAIRAGSDVDGIDRLKLLLGIGSAQALRYARAGGIRIGGEKVVLDRFAVRLRASGVACDVERSDGSLHFVCAVRPIHVHVVDGDPVITIRNLRPVQPPA